MTDDDDFLAGFTADQDDDSAAEQLKAKQSREERLRQTEDAFRAQVELWRPACAERQAALRIQNGFTTSDSLELKAASEERYFMRDYGTAKRIAETAMEVGKGALHPQELGELKELVEACNRKMQNKIPSS